MTRAAIYARVSTRDQDVGTQLADLREHAARREWQIVEEYVDHGVSGSRATRPALDRLMDDARRRRFEICLVWKFDRFARSTRHLVEALEEFRHLGIAFVSLTETIDTSSPLGQAMFTIIGAIAALERDLIAERVRAGVRRAQAEGKQIGRPRVNVEPEEVQELRRQGLSFPQIAKQLGIAQATAHKLAKGSLEAQT